MATDQREILRRVRQVREIAPPRFVGHVLILPAMCGCCLRLVGMFIAELRRFRRSLRPKGEGMFSEAL
jgi:hypothetical protein